MRLMLAGTHSGCGKTTAALALMARMADAGMTVAPFKSGPDYIDPGFHALAAGRVSHNLDLFLMGADGVDQVLQAGMCGAQIGVIEGAMSFYDGIGAEGRCSSHALAVQTDTPVILVVDASGSASGAAAVALGFRDYSPDSRIAGVLVNRASSQSHYELIREAIERRTGLKCVGYLRREPGIGLRSRHLGLVPADEVRDVRDRILRMAEALVPDLDALEEIASAAGTIRAPSLQVPREYEGFAMGVARDEAFGFYYEANLEMLRRMGMRLIEFSPLHDARLPDGLNGLWLGGGFPEVFAERLSGNASMLESLREAVSGGLPAYAECGGMMVLSRAIDRKPMAGVLPFECAMTGRLQHFGYVTVRDRRSGMTFPAHEFHHSVAIGAEGMQRAFDIRRASGRGEPWQGGIRQGSLLAGYPHVHFWGRPELVKLLWGLG